jgi:cyclic pyranopterin phosphate synthase
MNPAIWSQEGFVSYSEILSRLPFVSNASEWQEKNELLPSSFPSGPARYYVNAVTGQRVGVISAVSRHFCALCNRLRFTATGEIQSCLFYGGGISAFDALRARDEENLRDLILQAASLKPQVGVTSQHGRIDMYKIGG